MSMRDLDFVVRAYGKRKDRELDERFLVAAASTSEIVNILGSAYSTKEDPWQPVPASEIFNAWTGKKGETKVIDQEYVEAVMSAIKDREKAITFLGQN